MEENKRGQGIFLGVVGVATLVVAIIGATFAFFAASATNNTTIAGNTAAAGGLSLAITELVSDGSGLIPLNVKTGDTSGVDTTSQLSNALGASPVCVDSNGSQVCAIYKIAITNGSSTNKLLINGTLTMAFTGTNLRWGLLDKTSDSNITTVSSDTFTALRTSDANGIAKATLGYLTGETYSTVTPVELVASGTQYYYVLVWLEEMGTNQAEGVDDSKSYTGTVVFDATDSSGTKSGVTATFSA